MNPATGANSAPLPEALREKILNSLAAQKGRVGFYFKNMITGEKLCYQDGDVYRAASVIKLPILLCVSKWTAEGRASMAERIKVRTEDKVPNCGALTLFTDEPTADIRTLCNLMIAISDNTATNLLINRFGIPAYEEEFHRIGLVGTKLNRCLCDMDAASRGLQNYIVPQELGLLLEQIYRRSFVNPEVSESIEKTLRLQQINHKLCGVIGDSVPVAHKTGEEENITNDVGLVFAKQPFVVCYTGTDTDVPTFEDFIRHTTADLVEVCNR